MWDLPIRVLAFAMLALLSERLGRYKATVLGIAVLSVCLIDLRQYDVFFVRASIYEPVSEELMRAVNILK
jgi:hypothetical protein